MKLLRRHVFLYLFNATRAEVRLCLPAESQRFCYKTDFSRAELVTKPTLVGVVFVINPTLVTVCPMQVLFFGNGGGKWQRGVLLLGFYVLGWRIKIFKSVSFVLFSA